jgi:ketosteroid isomerase-like protein
LVGIIVAPTLLGGGDQSANVPGQNDQNPDNRSGGGPGQNQQQEPPARQPAAQQAPPEQSGQDQGRPRTDGGLTEEAAEQTVRDVYATAAEGDYDASYDLLSGRFKQSTAPTQAQWSGQFNTLQSIEFEEGPEAQVSGDTATVTGVTIAEHTDRTERNTVSWTLVDEGGEWRLDDLQLQERELL